MERAYVYIDRDAHRLAKIKSVTLGITLLEYLSELIRKDNNQQKENE